MYEKLSLAAGVELSSDFLSWKILELQGLGVGELASNGYWKLAASGGWQGWVRLSSMH